MLKNSTSPMQRLKQLSLLVLALFMTVPGAHSEDVSSLEKEFRNPPAETRPMTLWFWMNGHISREGITLDLEAMSEVGIGGALIFDGSNYFPEGPVPYMSPEWLELFTHAVREGERLGIGIGMHNGPGWSSSGGPWIRPEDSMKYLTWTETPVAGGKAVEVTLPQPPAKLDFYRDAKLIAFPRSPKERVPYLEMLKSVELNGAAIDPELITDQNLDTVMEIERGDVLTFEFEKPIEVASITVRAGHKGGFPRMTLAAAEDGSKFGDLAQVSAHGRHGIRAPGSASFSPTTARVFRLSANRGGLLGEVELSSTPRTNDWEYKTNLAFRVGRQMEIPEPGRKEDAIDPDKVIDLTGKMEAGGKLNWDAPPGDWTILRLGYTTTAHLNVAASASGTGLECDKFDPKAAELHFNNTVGRVVEAVGPLAGKSFKFVEIDSYEAGMQNWTAAFPEEFGERAGYDITPFLSALTGRVVGDAARTERFLFDFRDVQAEMMAENYYQRMGDLVAEYGMDFYVEGYGQGMFDELRVSGQAQIPMTEFWTRTPWTPNRTVKLVSSAAHVYGKKIVAAEAFTGEEKTSRWLNYPYALKAEGDYMFSLGLNQLIFHRFAHQPHPSAVPGMAMGPWGFHFDRTNTWFKQTGKWLDYISRCQFLLRQGTPVSDVLFFAGERPPNVAQWMRPAIPEGYDYDLIDAPSLINRITVKDGELCLPEGGRYRLLVLPETLRGVTPELMEVLDRFVEEGAAVVGPRPKSSLSLRSETPAAKGKGYLGELSVEDALDKVGLQPDFTYTSDKPDCALSWNHRRIEAGDLYFIGNRQRRSEEFVGSFRITGAHPEFWNPETGERKKAVLFEEKDGRTNVSLRLDPAESVFVLFPPSSGGARGATELRRDTEVLQAARPFPEATLPEITGDFTMAIWAKPDIELRSFPRQGTTGKINETGKFYAIGAPEADRLFGPGHAAAGLAVGRNGIYVVERSRKSAPAVLVSKQPVAGWNHFAVVYRDGLPTLYMNGEKVCDGVRSNSIVHPGVGLPKSPPDAVLHFNGLESMARASEIPLPPTQGRVFHFEGNLGVPKVFDHALSEEELASMSAKGPARPFVPPAAEIEAQANGELVLTAWESGKYQLDDRQLASLEVAPPAVIDTPWKLRFQPGRGAPEAITMSELESLDRNSEEGVRHFAGKVSYETNFDLAENWLEEDRRVVLDLGRVEVVATVKVNGVTFANLWKEPYRVDITDAVHAGGNRLVVEVTTLWPNRLIGDAGQPAEVEFGYGGGEAHSQFHGKGIKVFPDWFLAGEPKPAGSQTTFTTWKFYDADEPLVASGLLGPVILRNPVRLTIPSER